jgi:small subunit ribosomal protein S17
MTQAPETNKTRSTRRRMIGVVASNKCSKTITVRLPYSLPHPKYGKLIRHQTTLYAHDEKCEAKTGDTVEVVECRRYSKTKTWRLVRVIRRAPSE